MLPNYDSRKLRSLNFPTLIHEDYPDFLSSSHSQPRNPVKTEEFEKTPNFYITSPQSDLQTGPAAANPKPNHFHFPCSTHFYFTADNTS